MRFQFQPVGDDAHLVHENFALKDGQKRVKEGGDERLAAGQIDVQSRITLRAERFDDVADDGVPLLYGNIAGGVEPLLIAMPAAQIAQVGDMPLECEKFVHFDLRIYVLD